MHAAAEVAVGVLYVVGALFNAVYTLRHSQEFFGEFADCALSLSEVAQNHQAVGMTQCFHKATRALGSGLHFPEVGGVTHADETAR